MNENMIGLENYYPQASLIRNPERLMRQRFFPNTIHYFSKVVNLSYVISPRIANQLTMALFSIAPKKKVNAKHLKFYQRGNKETLICKKKRFNIYRFGHGPEIYLIHGWCSHGARWEAYVDDIVKKGFQAVVVDAPAHGTSPGRFLSIPAYIETLFRAFNNSKNLHAVISHSIGALCSTIALQQSKQSHNKIKLVLMSTFNSCQSLLEKFSRCIGIRETIINKLNSFIPRYAGNELAFYNLADHLNIMQSSALLIYDREDIVVPSKETLTILNQVKNIQYYTTVGLGHNLYDDQVRKRVIDFIN